VTDLVEQLARLSDEQRGAVLREAKAERQRRIQAAINRVRQTALAGLSGRKAARVIEDAARQRRRIWRDADARLLVEQQLREDLGSLDDLPGFERSRQLFKA